jgi:hypothetical protein
VPETTFVGKPAFSLCDHDLRQKGTLPQRSAATIFSVTVWRISA